MLNKNNCTDKVEINGGAEYMDIFKNLPEDYKALLDKSYERMYDASELEIRFRTMFETMALGVVFQDANGKIVLANPAAEKILGRPFDELLSMTSHSPQWDCIKEDGSEFRGEEHPAIVALQTGKPQLDKIMGILNNSDEKYHWALISSIPLFKQNESSPYNVYTTISDITERIESLSKLEESEQRFQSLYHQMDEGVALHQLILDSKGEPLNYMIIDTNNSYEKILGIKKNDVINRLATDVYGVEKAPYIEIYSSVYMSGSPTKFETFFEPLSKYFSVSVSPWGNNGFATIFSDITEAKKTEQALKESQAKLFAAFDNLPFEFWLCDYDNICVLQNNRSTVNNGNMIGKTPDEVFKNDPLALKEFVTSYNKCLQGEIVNLERTIVKNNQKKYIYTMLAPIRTDEKLIGTLGVNVDITERKDAELLISNINKQLEKKVSERTSMLNDALEGLSISNYELKEMNDALTEETKKLHSLNEKLILSERELQEALDTKNKFFSIIAHDLKNPIGSFMNLTELLNLHHDKLSEADLSTMLNNLDRAAKTTFELLSNLLDWSRSQVGRIDYNPISYEIAPIVDKVVKLIKLHSDSKNIELVSLIDNGMQAYFDREMMVTVLRNLISNAVKFSKSGDKVTVKATKAIDKVIISVEDTGVGMKDEDILKLFRLDKKFSYKGTENEIGTGLGLILCKEFVQKNGGELWAKSEYGVGSKFYFSLPVRQSFL